MEQGAEPRVRMLSSHQGPRELSHVLTDTRVCKLASSMVVVTLKHHISGLWMDLSLLPSM